MTDPIADLLTRIRNANSSGKKNLELRTSKLKRAVADLLKKEGYLSDVKSVDTPTGPMLQIKLRFGPKGEKVQIGRASCRERV